jgi:DNA polymerase-3 subunit epsilon
VAFAPFSFFFGRKSPSSQPPEVTSYLEQCKQPAPAHEWIVFDTETTGLSPTTDRIVSVGAVLVSGNSMPLTASHEWFIRVENQTQEGVAVHGILTHEDFQNEEDVLLQWLTFIQNRTLVAHHAAFDTSIVNHALQRHFGIKMKNKVLDTAHLAIKKDHYGRIPEAYSTERYTLDLLLKRFGIPVQDRHTALGDALATALLFLSLYSKTQPTA